jgi:hypothetical protein
MTKSLQFRWRHFVVCTPFRVKLRQIPLLLGWTFIVGPWTASAQSNDTFPVFRDRLENNFLNWSWGENESSQNREIEEGSAALSFTPTDYSGLYLKKNQQPLTTSDFKSLLFSIKTNSKSSQQIRIGIGEYGSDEALTKIITVNPGSWQRINLAFEDMESSIGNAFDKIYIQGGVPNTRGTFYVDSIYLIRASAAPPVPTPSPQPDPSPTPDPPSKMGKLRPLSKNELMFSLQDILALPNAPLLENFREQNSKIQVYRNSYDVLHDSANLRALERDIQAIIAAINLRDLARRLINCDILTAAMCRETFFQRIATHAWRRPLNPTEKSSLRTLLNALSKVGESTIDASLRLTLSSIFFDHRFLYRNELGIELDGRTAPDNRLATWERLAAITYTLTQRPPTYDQITQLSGYSSDARTWEGLVRTLAHSPGLSLALTDFISQWLMIYDLEYTLIPSAPQWSPTLARSYLDEMQRFVAQVLAEDGSLFSLMTRPNQEAHNFAYGIFGTRAFLTASGKNAQPSMIIRGVRILRNALCQTLPSPPTTIDTRPPSNLDPNDPNYDEKLVLLHSSKPACQGCHIRIDPAGLALQTYDGLGANRARPVDFDALGMSPSFSVSLGGQNEVISVLDPGVFADSMARSTVFSRCFARQALRFVIGRELDLNEIALADDLAAQHLAPSTGEEDSIPNFFEAMLKQDKLFQRL